MSYASKRNNLGVRQTGDRHGTVLGPRRRTFNPTAYSGLSAWYDASDASSLLASGGAAISNGAGVALVADKSGNSAVNCLCLPGATGNYASAPDSVPLSITGDIELIALVALNDWTPATDQPIISKWVTTGNQRSYQLYVLAPTGRLVMQWSPDGTSGAALFAASTVSPTVSDFGQLWIRATLDVDDGAGNRVVKFYTGGSGMTPTWVQLGSTVTAVGTTSIFDGTAVLEMGTIVAGASTPATGRWYRAQVRNGYDGTGSLVFDANFSTATKLATSFAESSSNAATVTINTSGDLGARISGERDYFQGTAANRLTYNLAGRYIRGDGVSDCARTPAFSLAQPWIRITVLRQNTWTNGDYLLGGANGANSGALIQSGSTPELVINAGSSVATNSNLAVATLGIVIEEFNGASSSLQVNRTTATTGNAGVTAANGLTLLASGASTAANFADGDICEQIVFLGVFGVDTKQRIAQALGAKWGIVV